VSADLGFHDAAFSVLRAMAAEKADAVLLGGDIAYTAWVKFLDFAASVARAPWMPSQSRHANGDKPTRTCSANG
jgi:hypothetical protein